VKRHLAENIYDYLPWIFKYSTDRKIRIFASLLFNWMFNEFNKQQKMMTLQAKIGQLIPMFKSEINSEKVTDLGPT
jgi:hypothetical protein